MDELVRTSLIPPHESANEAVAPLPPGDSREQREAEARMLEILGQKLGVHLEPQRIDHPSGSHVMVDGADEARTVLVECWAHIGRARGSQPNKPLVDAVKLHWVGESLPTRPRMIFV